MKGFVKNPFASKPSSGAPLPMNDDLDNPFEEEENIITVRDDDDLEAQPAVQIVSNPHPSTKKKNAYLTSVTSYFSEQKDKLTGKKPDVSDSFEESTTGASNDDIALREANLKKREEKMAAKERELDDLKRKIADGTVKTKNWPFSFWAFTYHSIKDEILPANQAYIRQFYRLLLFTWWCLVANFIATIFCWGGCSGEALDIIYNIIYCTAGFTGSWFLWYQQIYDSGKITSFNALRYARFYCGFFCHFAWIIITFSGVFSSLGGVLNIISPGLSSNTSGCYTYTVVDIIVTVQWGLNILVSLALLRLAYARYKAGGGSVSGMKAGVLSAAATSALSG